MGDPDHNLREYRIVTGLLALGAFLYFIPYVFGVQFNSVAAWTISNYQQLLVSGINLRTWAVGLAYVTDCPVCDHGSYCCRLRLEDWWPCRSTRDHRLPNTSFEWPYESPAKGEGSLRSHTK